MTQTEFAALARTAIRLRPRQVAHRARLLAQGAALRRWPDAGRRLLAGPDPSSARGWPGDFVPVDVSAPPPWPGPAELAAGRIELLGVTRALGDPPDWRQGDAPQLWRFHLHYWDWAWGLAAGQDRQVARAIFARLWRSWRAAVPFGAADAWLPYPAALRAWSWCGQYRDLVSGSELDGQFVKELAGHAGFLRCHLESDVGGNHLIKDLKALIGVAVFFGDDRLLRGALRRLSGQLKVQVLADGGHYERAPAYHCQVLADLIDVAGLAAAAGAGAMPELADAIHRMRCWLGCVLLPDGQVPLLNDGYPVPAGLVAVLTERVPAERVPAERVPARRTAAARRPERIALADQAAARVPAGPLVVLPDSGLIRAAIDGWHLLADVGPPCPDELPAHAHADTLGCLVQVDGAPLLVDTGTSTYTPGQIRSFERSTAAHSTVQIDGADSTEVWGAFRAGRRARVSGLTASATREAVTFGAAHNGFRRLRGSPVHHRRWSLTAAELRVDDEISGGGQHAITIRWYLAPGTSLRIDRGRRGSGGQGGLRQAQGTDLRSVAAAVSIGGGASLRAQVSASCPVRLEVESAQIAVGFSRTAAASVLTCRANADLPVHITSSWRKGHPSADHPRDERSC